MPENIINEDHLVKVDREELAKLIAQNAELKVDIIALVNVFGQFEGLFTGKSLVSAVPTILKLINDKDKLAAIGEIVPIIQKYTHENTQKSGQ